MEKENEFQLINKYRGCLMGFAALWILIFHQWTVLFKPVGVFVLETFIKRIGFCGVDIFLFLSGMGLYFSIQSHSILQFYYRRIRRLIIPVLAVGLFSCVVDNWTFLDLIKNVFGINFYAEDIYTFLWFVPAIATLYFFFPLYYKIFSRASDKTIFTLCVLILWLLASLALRDTMRQDLFGFTNRIPIFCTGCFVGYLSEQEKLKFSRSTWILLILTFILGLYLSWLTNFKDMQLLVPTPNCCVPNFLMTISISILFPKVFELLCNIPKINLVVRGLICFLSFLGTFSLELYCVQERFAEVLAAEFAMRYNALIKNILTFISVIAAGFIIYLIQKVIWRFIDSKIVHD